MQHFISRRTSKLYASRNEVIVIRKTSDWASRSLSAQGEELRRGGRDRVVRPSPLPLVHRRAARSRQPTVLARYCSMSCRARFG